MIRTGLLLKVDVIDPQAAQHALPRFLTSPPDQRRAFFESVSAAGKYSTVFFRDAAVKFSLKISLMKTPVGEVPPHCIYPNALHKDRSGNNSR